MPQGPKGAELVGVKYVAVDSKQYLSLNFRYMEGCTYNLFVNANIITHIQRVKCVPRKLKSVVFPWMNLA